MGLVFYSENDDQEKNVLAFKRIVEEFGRVKFYNPSPNKAPWHVKAVVNGHDLNFWPHKMKGSVDGGRTKCGRRALTNMLIDCLTSKGQGITLVE